MSCMLASMSNRPLISFLLCIAPIVSCSNKTEQQAPVERMPQDEELRRYLDTPQYGLEHALAGKMMFGQEMSIIGLCDRKRAACELPRNVDGSEQPCWLTFTERGSTHLKRMSRTDYVEDGEYWIEGIGRIAVHPGGFGHMSGYTCQVELSSVRAFEVGPPHFWELPPPES